ncbi:class I SAM-dependent methyltransferase [Sediminibacterium soli]|uniref:class I SAM-dependent methyltransferase n=1 Tax=Sediminibacterium soli TaxID=2698829 RepID=UPI0013799BBF|nr:class I SAM-dependent methyltransferase [Sediminibacterium soli]NCI47836.1 class I SAM-dependent methyltransferase [Sediminibacterium soli]
MKDHFSQDAARYAQFRPQYPLALAIYLSGLISERRAAWDCGTGNGQFAALLADYFDDVFATDISAAQIANAVRKANISYSIQPAETTGFPDRQFTLVTVAQAIHWFDFTAFYREVKRVLQPGGIIAVIGYGLLQTEPHLQQAIDHLYKNTLGSYWHAERRYIDEAYRTIPFPFTEMEAPAFDMYFEWTHEQLIGYLNTWSAVKQYTRIHGHNPVEDFEKELPALWKNDTVQTFRFPLLLRIGRNQ